MKSPINSRKHIRQITLSTVAAGATNAERIVDSVQLQDVNTVTEVQEGALVKAIFIELWLQNTSSLGFEITVFSKTNDATDGPSHAEMLALDTYVQKKNILFTHEGLSSNDAVGNPIAVFRAWLKIPKGKQRFGLGDRFIISISNPSANTLNYCGQCIYKEYT